MESLKQTPMWGEVLGVLFKKEKHEVLDYKRCIRGHRVRLQISSRNNRSLDKVVLNTDINIFCGIEKRILYSLPYPPDPTPTTAGSEPVDSLRLLHIYARIQQNSTRDLYTFLWIVVSVFEFLWRVVGKCGSEYVVVIVCFKHPWETVVMSSFACYMRTAYIGMEIL